MELGVRADGLVICSHINPIDPGEYPCGCERPEEEWPHEPIRQDTRELQPPAPKPLTDRSSERHDRIIPIAPQDWRSCFDRFSRSHEGWLATLTVCGPQTCQTEARDLPFAGVVQEPSRKAIWIRLGSLAHFAGKPTAVWLRIGHDGAEKALGIETTNATALLEFRSALPTEMVDGIAPFPTRGPAPIRSIR
jgi:Family of unknown function (DUF5335)